MSGRIYRSMTDGEPFIVMLKGSVRPLLSWRLVVVAGGQRTSHGLSSPSVVIGRSSAAGIQVEHASVSRMQCVVETRGQRLFLRDCGDEIGVLVEGVRVPRWGECELESGMAVTLSSSVYVRVVQSREGSAAP